MPTPSKERAVEVLRICLALVIFLSLASVLRLRIESSAWTWSSPLAKASHSLVGVHPIHRLTRRAETQFRTILLEDSFDLKDAAIRYRKRRGRHPPPGFDEWVQWAQKYKSPLIESLYDQLYDDIEPFWALEPSQIRADAASWSNVLSIRNGTVRRRSALPSSFANWIGRWEDLLRHIPAGHLPDVDLAFNPDDDAHIFVPWEDIQQYREIARESKHVRGPEDTNIVSNYSTYDPIPDVPTFKFFRDAPSESNLWRLARNTCHPTSIARTLEQENDTTVPATFPEQTLGHLRDGYVENWVSAKSICHNPHLRNLYGYLLNTNNGSLAHWNLTSHDRLTTRTLFPLLSPGKLQDVNNDILVPAAMYWQVDDKNPLADVPDEPPWSKKVNKAVWRGSANGGFNNETNWTRFNRHRFISMMNGTQVNLAQEASSRPSPAHVPGGDPPLPYNFPLPDRNVYPLATLKTPGELGRWLKTVSDGAFTYLRCWPPSDFFKNYGKCPYTDHWYDITTLITQYEYYSAKYLPDVDGHGYSGRWRSFLFSQSVPIKATVWSEWHDSRLIPWHHFVPMDNTMMDWFGIMEFFVGYKPSPGVKASPVAGHDNMARAIALNGQDWARKVLRREDMVLYFWRLILEYARICDDRRVNMGWIEDLR